MKCPTCGTAFHFQPTATVHVPGRAAVFEERIKETDDPSDPLVGHDTKLLSAVCPECGHMVVMLRLVQVRDDGFGGGGEGAILQEHVIYPPRAAHSLPDAVPERLRRDFLEAAAVVDQSPKASAAISRRILQDVLRETCGGGDRNLSMQVAAFIKKPGVPSRLAELLHALREVGNFAAHTQKDTSTGEVLDVEPGEAEWLIEILDELFDHVYVQPAKHSARLGALNERLVAAGRNPLREAGR